MTNFAVEAGRSNGCFVLAMHEISLIHVTVELLPLLWVDPGCKTLFFLREKMRETCRFGGSGSLEHNPIVVTIYMPAFQPTTDTQVKQVWKRY